MSGFKEPSFADRQKAAQQAKQDILNKFRAKPGPDDPAVKQRQAEREAQAAARAKAKEAREAAKAEQKAARRKRPRQPQPSVAREKEEDAARELPRSRPNEGRARRALCGPQEAARRRSEVAAGARQPRTTQARRFAARRARIEASL